MDLTAVAHCHHQLAWHPQTIAVTPDSVRAQWHYFKQAVSGCSLEGAQRIPGNRRQQTETAPEYAALLPGYRTRLATILRLW